jgi:AraC-like DNA-binding protein
MDMIFTIGIFTSLFFFVLLLNKKHKSLPDNILAIWMLVIGIHLTNYYIYAKGYWDQYPHLIGITAPVPFFYGPLLYLYVAYSISDRSTLRRQDFLHFLPVLLSYLYLSKFFFFYSAEQKRMVDQGLVDDFGTFSNLMVIGFIVSAIAYAICAYRLLNRYKRLLENNFSNPERINLNWLKGFIWGVALLFTTVTVVLVSKNVLGISYPFTPDLIFYAIIVLGILCLGYFGIRHQNIFTDNVVLDEVENTRSHYKKSSLNNDLAVEKHQALTKLMTEQKPYLESNLTLNGLAEKLDVSLHHLSQIINQFEGQNFNDFVNKYRVEEFIERASKDSHYSFLALALDSGFNSKSTFNAVFRKHKGVTPSQFLATQVKKAS